MRRHDRRAGVSVPLFSLRSTRSWGIGEIGDIPLFARWLQRAAQSVLQILPLNELAPAETSPYSSLSAMAIDPQFISIWMMEGGDRLEAECRAEIDALRRTSTVDYAGVRAVKNRALRTLFERFLETDWRHESPRARAFRAYVTQEAWWLDDYSLYRALRFHAGERPWTEWPQGLRDRERSALARARAELAREVLFRQYLQWTAATQWESVRDETSTVEILGDFPFMVTGDSADVWSRPQDFILDASVGTPPDAFSEVGQEWGLPPYNWDAARRNDFEWLRMRARRQSELYDGFRVDHLVGFYRTFIRPFDGRPPYFLPADEDEQTALGESSMRIIIDTAADVSVEDLGVVPDFVRESIVRLGLPGYKVLRWEPDPPELYPTRSVAMTGTHDTEPLASWWETLTLAERERFGSLSTRFDAETRDAILESVYNAGSDLVLLPLQDVFGWPHRINQPATVSDNNWTYVLPWPVDEFELQPEAVERAARVTEWCTRADRWHPDPEQPA